MAAFVKSLFSTPPAAPYTVVREESGYEVRSYPARLWVTSTRTYTGDTPNLDDKSHRSGLFHSLFRYITGTNQNQQKMPMTVPVTMQWVPDASGAGGTYNMAFYVNDEYQQDVPPPEPTEEGVAMERRPDMTVLVAGRGGYVSEADWNTVAAALKETAEKNGETGFDFSRFYRVGYDAPAKFWNRRNEVWFVKEEEDTGKKVKVEAEEKGGVKEEVEKKEAEEAREKASE